MVKYCGVLTSVLFSSIVFKDNAEVTYNYSHVHQTAIIMNLLLQQVQCALSKEVMSHFQDIL